MVFSRRNIRIYVAALWIEWVGDKRTNLNFNKPDRGSKLSYNRHFLDPD